jgi:predicted dehydrogenase
MQNDSRRNFVKTVALTAASASRVLGANDRVRIGVVGLGGRGRAHMNEWSKVKGSEIAALCDVNQAALERGQAQVLKLTEQKPTGYADMRKLFEDKNIDAVSMPLPNHWHALATIWAVQAGKDVYIEKPACHNPWEGKKMVEAARKYNRMVQVGSQSRSTPHKIEAMAKLHEGVIGPLWQSKGICYKRRVSIGKKADEPTPPGLDWAQFLGPAPLRPYNELRFRYNWHWFWDTGNGDIGNQGVHEMDLARWALGAGMPASVVSTGGKYAYDDDQETPNTQLARFDYGNKELVFDVHGLITDHAGALPFDGQNCVGNVFYGLDGFMSLDDDGYQIYKGEKRQLVADVKAAQGSTTAMHMDNFAKAVRSRNYKDLTADVQIGVDSANLCHLANISYRLKRRLEWDPAAERFKNDPEANKLLTREYRKPYVVPEKV